MFETENKENISLNPIESEPERITQYKQEITDLKQSIELLKSKIKLAQAENAQKTSCYENKCKETAGLKQVIKNVVQKEQHIRNNTKIFEASHLAYIKQLMEYQKFKTITNEMETKMSKVPPIMQHYQLNQEKMKTEIDKTLSKCCQVNNTIEDLMKEQEATLKAGKEKAQDKREIAKLEAAIKRIELKSAFIEKSLERKEDEIKALSELHTELQGARN